MKMSNNFWLKILLNLFLFERFQLYFFNDDASMIEMFKIVSIE